VNPKFALSLIEAVDTHPLRMSVLRPGLPAEKSYFIGDDLITTFHLGIQDTETKKIVCNGTFMLNECPYFPELNAAYRLRGMATDPNYRGLQLGRHLLQKAEEEIKNRGGTFLWFNARLSAFGFYQKLGYESVGDLFDIADIGAHQVMYKRL
jgi:GNAT superfamily N-acetyltransferase